MFDHKALIQEADTLDSCGLDLVQAELEHHNLGHVMNMVSSVVPRLRTNPRMRQAHSTDPYDDDDDEHEHLELAKMLKIRAITDVELFSLLIYTGTKAQGEIRRAMRMNPDDRAEAESWKWTIAAIRHAVIKLAETPPAVLYHGLNGVKVTDESSVGVHDIGTGAYWNLVSGSMSERVAKDFASGNGGTVRSRSSLGTVLRFRFQSDDESLQAVACADLRWISKFPYEEEWLMVPLSSNGVYVIYDHMTMDQALHPERDSAETWEVWKNCTLNTIPTRWIKM